MKDSAKEKEATKKCNYCRNEFVDGVSRYVVYRNQGQACTNKLEFCSSKCSGNYQMAMEG